MFTSINEIVQLSRENGYTFFNKDRQEEHKTRVLPTLYGGKYFITENIQRVDNSFLSTRLSRTVLATLFEVKSFYQNGQERRYLKIAILDNETEEVSYELQ